MYANVMKCSVTTQETALHERFLIVIHLHSMSVRSDVNLLHGLAIDQYDLRWDLQKMLL